MDDDIDFLVRRREHITLGLNDSTLRRSLRGGQLLRVVTGIYAERSTWSQLSALEQHLARVRATAERLRSAVVFSHFAAAALWGIRILGSWPTLVDVTLDRASGGRSDGGLRRHCTGLESTEVVMLCGVNVTSPAQTVVDLARMLPFGDGVVAMDSALHRKRKPAPLATQGDFARVLDAASGRRGHRKAAVAAAFATPLSDSPEESHSRVQIHLLGFPPPELQREFTLPDGRRAETDFYWPEFRHIGEFDGRGKYTDPAILRGKTPAQVAIDEKNRENELRRMVRGFSRWETRDLYPPRRLYDRLLRDGLPTSRRCP